MIIQCFNLSFRTVIAFQIDAQSPLNVMLNEDADSGMICVVILNDDNEGQGLTLPITVDFVFFPNGGTPEASKLLPTFVSDIIHFTMHACDDIAGCIELNY